MSKVVFNPDSGEEVYTRQDFQVKKSFITSFLMKLSLGIIKTQSQANIAMVVISVFAFLLSIYFFTR